MLGRGLLGSSSLQLSGGIGSGMDCSSEGGCVTGMVGAGCEKWASRVVWDGLMGQPLLIAPMFDPDWGALWGLEVLCCRLGSFCSFCRCISCQLLLGIH